MDSKRIKKILEHQVNESHCVHEQYEQACGLWCKLNLEWCSDMSGRCKKLKCQDFQPSSSGIISKEILNLINQYETRIEELEDILDAIEANDYY